MSEKTGHMRLYSRKDCPQCNVNIKIIEKFRDSIDGAAMDGMQQCRERVAVIIEILGKKARLFPSIPIKTLIKMEKDKTLKTAFENTLEELKTGETLVVIKTANNKHFGVYKLPAGPLH